MSTNATNLPRRRHSRRVWILSALAGVGGLSAGYVVSRMVPRAAPDRPDIQGLLWPDPRRLGAFELDATDGESLDLERLRGRWSFVFFGFTFCPDVCPTTLATMAATMKRLRAADAARDVQTIFVSVDPGRDTLERLASYVAFFDPTFIGATAPLDRLDGLARQLGVLHVRGEPDETGNYEVDHTASVLLIDPRARIVGIFGAPHAPQDIARRFQAMREFLEKQS